jgi:hypothetical protein
VSMKSYRLALESIAAGGRTAEELKARAARALAGGRFGARARRLMPVDPPDPFAWARGAPLERGPRPLREGERR